MQLENIEYFQLCHMAGLTEAEANRHGITRSELIYIVNQKKV